MTPATDLFDDRFIIDLPPPKPGGIAGRGAAWSRLFSNAVLAAQFASVGVLLVALRITIGWQDNAIAAIADAKRVQVEAAAEVAKSKRTAATLAVALGDDAPSHSFRLSYRARPKEFHQVVRGVWRGKLFELFRIVSWGDGWAVVVRTTRPGRWMNHDPADEMGDLTAVVDAWLSARPHAMVNIERSEGADAP